MKKLKVLTVAAMSMCLFLSGSFHVSAAGLKDLFDADYYAAQYPDLREAFGNDEDALYQHFLEYGLKEGRNMNPILNVVAYRDAYEDLDAAFGDDWNAYVEHFLTCGVYETGRRNGVLFDPLAYAGAYEDIREACGNNIESIIAHYQAYGMNENRTEGTAKGYSDISQEKQATAEAKRKAAEQKKEQETANENKQERVETCTYKNGLKVEDYYNAEGVWEKSTHYAPNGKVTTFAFKECDSDFDFVQPTYNGNYIYNISSSDMELGGQYYPAIGIVFPDLNGNAGIRFHVHLDETGNYIFECIHSSSYYDLSVGTYTFDANGTCIAEPSL